MSFRKAWSCTLPLVLVLGASALYAQTSTLSGTIKDPTGAVVTRAVVSVTESKTATQKQAVADATGTYTVSGLTAGDYTVAVDAPGFAAFKKSVAVGAGETKLDIALMLAAETGAVSVGSAGNERQIHNVAAGRISATSTDAVNGSQLYIVMNNVGHNIQQNGTDKSRINNNGTVNYANGN
mgnify:CR=1 FL=1